MDIHPIHPPCIRPCLHIRDGNKPSSTEIFKPENSSQFRTIPSLIVFSPNKSKGWLLLIIYLLQVRQTENRIPSAILFRFLPVIIFIVFPSNQSVARTDWNRPELSIRGAGQEDRSSGNENDPLSASVSCLSFFPTPPPPLHAYSRHFSRGLCSETARKRLLRRLQMTMKNAFNQF